MIDLIGRAAKVSASAASFSLDRTDAPSPHFVNRNITIILWIGLLRRAVLVSEGRLVRIRVFPIR